MRRTITTIFTTAILASAGTMTAQAAMGWEPQPYAQKVTGNPGDGWTINWRTDDGGSWRQNIPTRSEGVSECREYYSLTRQARCTATVRTTHHWLGVTKRSLNHAR